MDVEVPHFLCRDILTVLHVCENVDDTFFNEVNFSDIIRDLNHSGVLDNEKKERLMQCYIDTDQSSLTLKTTKKEFYSFLMSVCQYVPFFTFCDALCRARLSKLSQQLIERRISDNKIFVLRGTLKRELPNDEEIHMYYVNEKGKIDNNTYKNQARAKFREEIALLNSDICRNIEDKNKVQFFIDKKCILYFLLAQQYASEVESIEVLMEMRKDMPHDVDRTLFDTIFHSYMAFNYASSGEAELAENHTERAVIVSSSCTPGLVRILAAQWCQYVNTILYTKGQCRDKSLVKRANQSFGTIQQYLQDLCESDERQIWQTISVLDMARTVVGITPKLEMCEIENIDTDSISQAKLMVKQLKRPAGIRRRMYLQIILGRIYETSDRKLSIKHFTNALELAPDGCYDALERCKISNYLEKLYNERLPNPSL